MIIARLLGGLGNQMFQYATGRALALRTGAELKLDLAIYEHSTARTYALRHFPIQAVPATRLEVEQLTRIRTPERVIGRLLRRKLRPRRSHVREPDLRFHPWILNLPDNVYLDGYWQSERYFVDATTAIQKELRPPEPASVRDREVAAAIDSTESISLHIRRGDYVSSRVAREILGPCGLDYYQRALAMLRERLAQPHLFAFSDEPDWVIENFKTSIPMTVVDHNSPSDPHLDLALMSRCRHHVIANSSFSWWAAWLAPAANKIIIAPHRWFAQEELRADDLVPQRWIRL